MKIFSDYAHDKMMSLFDEHSNEVGSELKKTNPIQYKDYKSTDCITYSLNVIAYAFEKRGNTEAASQVWKLGKRGTELARYLVNSHGWVGIYVNPDSKHPIDVDPEHTYTSHLATKTCKYYQIPLSYKVHNYTITPNAHKSFQKLNRDAGVSKLDSIAISSLDNVTFGFGVSRGGMHTWVFSRGRVYEVHWDKVGSELYEASSLRTFPWLSGVIVVPSDQVSKIEASAKLTCTLA